MAEDRFKKIKRDMIARAYGAPTSDMSADVVWLIEEVERLRETIDVLSDPAAMQAIKEGQENR